MSPSVAGVVAAGEAPDSMKEDRKVVAGEDAAVEDGPVTELRKEIVVS